MKTRVLTGLVSAGFLMAAAQGAIASDFKHVQVACPKDGFQLIGTPDGNININDIIISSDAPTDFLIRYVAPGGTAKRTVLRVYLPGNDTVVTNFSDPLDGEREWSVRATCRGEAKVEVTIAGSGDVE